MSSKDFVPFEERPKPKSHESSHQSETHEQDMASLLRDFGPYMTAQGRPIPSAPVSSKKLIQMQAAWKQQDAECSRDPDDPIRFPTKKLRQITSAPPQKPAAPMFPVKADVKMASARVQGHGAMPESPEQQLHHKFETDVAAKAQGLLKANKDRLNSEQAQYTQDKNPKSDRWSHLWQVAAQRREFQAQQANLQQQLEFTVGEINNLSDMADGTGLMSTPQQQQNSPKHKKLLALSDQKRRLEERINQAKQMQVSLEYDYPALAAVKGETGANAGDIQAVQGRLPQEFDGIRDNIDKLGGEISQNPSMALLFDSVVTNALRQDGHNNHQIQELSGWLARERENKEGLSRLGQVLGGGLFVASFIPQLRGLSPLLKFFSAGAFGIVFAHDLPNLMLLDAAAQSGRGGAGKLTGQSPEEARFNLVMGYANVALACLDVAAEVRVMRHLERLVPELSAQGAHVLRETWVKVLGLASQGKAGLAKARVLLAKIKGMSPKMADEVIEIVGVPGQSGMKTAEENVKDAKALQARTAARASGKAHVLEDYANAGAVKPFIGTKVDTNHLPEGYLYGKIPTGKDALGQDIYREVVYMPESNQTRVPLKVKNGRIEMGVKGEYRIVDEKVYPQNVVTDPNQPGKFLGGKSQVHHLFADNMLRTTPFGQQALRLGAVNPDGSINLIELANSRKNLAEARTAYPNVEFSDFIHQYSGQFC
jgi:hypothetical protein